MEPPTKMREVMRWINKAYKNVINFNAMENFGSSILLG